MILEMLKRCCPVCGSTDDTKIYAEADFDPEKWDSFAFASRKLPEYMHYRLITCPDCDLLYANPIPPLESLAAAYHDAAFDSREEAGHAAKTYGNILSEITPRLEHRDGALDIGTGDGAFLRELINAGFTNVQGVEPSMAPIEMAAPDIKPLIRHGLFQHEDYALESLQIVTCFQTIEHLYDPMQMCCDVFKILKPGGVIFLICHNSSGLSVKLLGMKSPIFDIEHLQLFSPDSAKNMLERAGYQNVVVKSLKNTYPLKYWAKLFPLPIRIKRFLLKKLDSSTLGALPISLSVGNLVVIGSKPT